MAMIEAGAELTEVVDSIDEKPISVRAAVLGSIEGRIGAVLGVIVLSIIIFGRFLAPTIRPTSSAVPWRPHRAPRTCSARTRRVETCSRGCSPVATP